MAINVGDVLSVYKKTGGIMDDAASTASLSPSAGGASFSDTLKGFVGQATSSLHAGENAATQSVAGTGNLASVVTAIDNAEIVLTEITSLRDKALAAYQTITSSAI